MFPLRPQNTDQQQLSRSRRYISSFLVVYSQIQRHRNYSMNLLFVYIQHVDYGPTVNINHDITQKQRNLNEFTLLTDSFGLSSSH